MAKIRFMGPKEIQERLGVSRQRAYDITHRRDFPEPYQELAMGSIWEASVIEEWIQTARPHLAEQAGHPEEP